MRVVVKRKEKKLIPKVINYCWFGGNELPKEAKKCIESWKKHCPDYQIVEWNESNFDVHCHPFVESAYKAKAWAFVSDYARLKIIYDNGGIYLDTDVKLLKNIDFLLQNEMYIGVQQLEKLCTTGLGYGAQPHHPIVKQMMDKYNDIRYSNSIREEIACPRLNNSVIEKYGYHFSDEIKHLDKITIFPPRYVDPLGPGNTQNLLCDDSFSMTLYIGSWTSKRNRIKRKIFNLIGQDKINILKKIMKR